MSSDQQTIAVQNLERLAVALRGAGLTVTIDPDSLPFPGLTATAPGRSVVIVAGLAYYWRPEDGDLHRVAALDELAAATREIRNHLAGMAGKHGRRRR